MINVLRYGVGARLSKAALVLLLAAGAARAEPLELVALGDSLTQGYGLPEAQGFVPQLEAWLTERGHDVDVINAGVSGDTTAGGLSRIEWSLSEDTDAVIVALGGNDMLRGIDPEVSRANLEGILEVTGERDLPVLLAGLDAPTNYGSDYKAAFEGMYPELAESHGARLYPDFFAGIGGGELEPAEMTRFMQDDGIHPNAEGVARIVADIGPEVEALLGLAAEDESAAAGSN